MSKFHRPYPVQTCADITFPTTYILLVTLNRSSQLNAITRSGHHELDELFQWMDDEPSIRVGIITGSGRAFCAGADLKEWNRLSASKIRPIPASGFAGLSCRAGVKPVIAAVNGLCLGGGVEMIVNCDMVLATQNAVFALPEVQRGLVPIAGALPRLIRTLGRPRATEMVLLCREIGAREAYQWGMINRVVEVGEDLIAESIKAAKMIARGSPDAVLVSRKGLLLGWEAVSVKAASDTLRDDLWSKIKEGENAREGIRAFAEKRTPEWRPSRL